MNLIYFLWTSSQC